MNGHWKKQFNYDYLGSYSLDGKKEVVVSIKGVGTAKVTGQSGRKEDCFVVNFNEFDKPMILNRTNAKAIEKVASSGLVEDWVGVAEAMDPQDIMMYPNPALDQVELIIDRPGAHQVTVMSTTGQVVYSFQTTATLERLEVGGWAPGIYLVKIAQGQQQMVVRLAVQ